jgi:predicted Fe-Mo cluster-binding NifX family protein
MKHEMVALPVYKERISPLLDVAKKFAVYEIEDGEIRQKITLDIHSDEEPERVDRLRDIGVSVIIGGAVSGFMSGIIREKGIRLISWTNGPVDEIIESYLEGMLKPDIVNPRAGCKRRKRGNRNTWQCRDSIIND